YLAAAGISFLTKKPDDSHTNLGFIAERGEVETHPLSENNDKLILNYNNFSLEWKSNSGKTTFKLDGATHAEVLHWLSETSKAQLNKEYNYNLHYDLPYTINETSKFNLSDVDELKELMHLRILAQFIIEKIDQFYNLNTSIRIWPHHFDTGLYDLVPGTDFSVGLGLAIPDSVCDEHYLYITGYKNGKAIDTSGFDKLVNGEWKSEGFTGAILGASGIVESDGVDFFKEVIGQLISK
ncbi:MAG: hypothetical protein ABJN84_13665, partial [Flavobacteriaceae bacterium]